MSFLKDGDGSVGLIAAERLPFDEARMKDEYQQRRVGSLPENEASMTRHIAPAGLDLLVSTTGAHGAARRLDVWMHGYKGWS